MRHLLPLPDTRRLEAEIACQLALLRQGDTLTAAERRLLDDPALYAVVVQVVARTLAHMERWQQEQVSGYVVD
jgi:hypothetical protein